MINKNAAARVKIKESNLPFVTAISMGIFFLAWLIRKEIQLPSFVILALGSFGLLTLLVLALRRPELPLYVLAAYLPFNRMLVGDFGTELLGLNLTNILMGLATAGWFLRAASKREPLFRRTALNGWLAAFILLGFISVYRGSQLSSGSSFDLNVMVQMKRWFTPIWLFFVGANLIQDRQTIKRLMIIISIAVVVVAAMAVRDYSYVKDLDLEKARIGGVIGQSNALGAFFSYYMFIMAGALLHYAKRLRSWMLLAPLLLCLRGIMVTFSRGAYLAFATGSLALCFFRSKRLFMAALMALVIIGLNPWMLPGGVQYRFSQTVKYEHVEQLENSLEGSAAGRIKIWRAGLALVRDHPMWGVGFGMFQYIGPRYGQMPGRIDAHNTYLLVAGEMGIPALVIFLIVLFMVLWHSKSLTRLSKDPLVRALGLGVAAGTAALLMSNMFGSRMNSPNLISYFWLLAGVIVGTKVLVKRGVLE